MAESVPDCDVLIVGAGPTGSTLALLLAREGLRITIVDQEADIYPLPRAAHVDHETMRIFQQIGVADAVAESSRQVERYDFVNRDGAVLLRFSDANQVGAGGWPASNMIHQPSIERALRASILLTPEIDLRTSWVLADLPRDSAGEAVFDTPAGRKKLTARFIVGADGARSAVRTLSGIELNDLEFDEPWLVVDTIVHDQSRLPPVNLQICDPARPTTCVLMGSGRHRWEFMLKPGETAEEVSRPDFVTELLRPWEVEGAVEIERTAVYRFSAKIAAEWRVGSVLLAGDAAHLMPPFAGQGLCSGLRDAANIAWKLAAILRDGAPVDRLLSTYHAEREPHVRSIVGLAMMMGRTVCLLDVEAADRRDAEMLAARASVPAERTGGDWPPFTAGCLVPNSARAGVYFPQLPADDGGAERLDDVLGRGAWLLARAGPAPTAPSWQTWTLDDEALAPFRGGLAGWLDEIGAAAVLVRPDRYVFGSGDAATLAAAYLGFVTSGGVACKPATIDLTTKRKDHLMSIDGTYETVVKSPMGDQKAVLTVVVDGGSFTGTNSGAGGAQDITGTVDGQTLSWQQQVTVPMPMTLEMTATFDGDALTGTVKAGAFGSFPMTGQRAV